MASLRLATRGSPLARRQSELVADRLHQVDPSLEVEIVLVETVGDARQDVSISTIAGRGVFSTEVDRAVFDRRADLAVHSAKDLPASDAPGLLLAAFPERADPHDALVGHSLEELRPGSVVATGAPRRRVQLAHDRPDLSFAEVRGNIGTRLTKVPVGGALVVALAALNRLSLAADVAEVLPYSVMLPQVGQGAIALRCREDDRQAAELASAIDNPLVHRCVLAERAFLARLGGGCDAPVAAHAEGEDGELLCLEAMVGSLDGHVVVRRVASGSDPVGLGTSIAESMLNEDGAAGLVVQP